MSTLGDYNRCRNCGQYDWANRHRCPPKWEAREVSKWGNEWCGVYAYDEEAAAARFAEEYDQSGGEYSIVRAGSAEVEVRKAPEFEMEDDEIAAIPVTVWDVSAESVPQYWARSRP